MDGDDRRCHISIIGVSPQFFRVCVANLTATMSQYEIGFMWPARNVSLIFIVILVGSFFFPFKDNMGRFPSVTLMSGYQSLLITFSGNSWIASKQAFILYYHAYRWKLIYLNTIHVFCPSSPADNQGSVFLNIGLYIFLYFFI